MREKLTQEFVAAKFKECGYKLIGTYVKSAELVKYLCPIHGEKYISYNNLSGGRRCRECSDKIKGDNKRLSYEFVKEQFVKQGYMLLSDTYTDNEHKLRYICSKHGEQSITYGKLSMGARCSECSNESRANKSKTPIETINKAFKDRGFTLLSNSYDNAHQKLMYLCNTHGEQFVTYNSFSQGSGCPKCANDANRGSNNPAWKGGVMSVSSFVRRNNTGWIQDSLMNANYICMITNIQSHDLEVHHLHSFHCMIEETMDILQLNIRPNIGDYTEEELCNIRNVFSEIQNRYKPMVIDKKIHKLFHSIYGYTNNTPDQFQEFTNRFHNNEFTEQLRAS